MYYEHIFVCQVTIMRCPPPVILRLAKDPMVDRYDLSSVDTVLIGAAPVPLETLAQVEKRLDLKHVKQGEMKYEKLLYKQGNSVFI